MRRRARSLRPIRLRGVRYRISSSIIISFALRTLEASGDFRKVSQSLGHASIQSTEACLRVDPFEKLENLAARLPPSIVKGSFNDVTERLFAVLAEARSA